MTDTRVVAIAGPRQSGKTTLARSIAGDTYTYLTLDDPAVLSAALSDPAGLVRRLDKAVIDEIQRAPELVLAIKQSVDEDLRPGRFLITGSADILAMPKAAESLAGRVEIIPLLPLSLAEITGNGPSTFLEKAFSGAFRDPEAPAIDMTQRVLAGGFPEALTRPSDRRRRDWHRAYLRSLLDRDLRDISSAARLDRMPDIFALLSARAGQLVNWSSLGNDARLNGKTVERYVSLLEQLYLMRRLPAWSGNQTQRLVSTPKLHFIDSGLLASTLGMTDTEVAVDRSPLHARDLTLSHYRDKDQVEVDFVIEADRGDMVAVEVKASATVRTTDFHGLRRLKDRVGKRFACGIVLYDGAHILPFGDRLLAVPLSSLGR
jgi:uncharacterized protein